jgi:hypothetical protein
MITVESTKYLDLMLNYLVASYYLSQGPASHAARHGCRLCFFLLRLTIGRSPSAFLTKGRKAVLGCWLFALLAPISDLYRFCLIGDDGG